MTIETKYDIGQELWRLPQLKNNQYTVESLGTIREITIRPIAVANLGYEIFYEPYGLHIAIQENLIGLHFFTTPYLAQAECDRRNNMGGEN